jgi:two-component system OmpR family sensor kinase
MLVVIAVALCIDTDSRASSIDGDLRSRASTLADLVSFSSDHDLHLGDVERSKAAEGADVLGFVTTRSIVYATPGQDALPGDAELRAVLQRLRHHDDPDVFTAPDADGHERHWAASGIDDLSVLTDGGFVQGFAIVGSDVPGAAQHAALRSGLLGIGAVLVVAAALLGHLLSGWAMRPATRGLAAQEQFLLEASHELRTPLSVLRVVLEAARRAATGPPVRPARGASAAGSEADRTGGPSRVPQDDVTTAIDRADRQVERMHALTETLLVRARASIGATAIPLEPLRLDQLVEGVLAELAETDVEAPPVDLVTEPVVVDGDVELLMHLVRNLVVNARRHGAPPLTVRVVGQSLSVGDGGVGVPENQRHRVLRSGATSGAGTGTGLAIVAWVVRVHRSSVRLGDAAQGGLLVTVQFPPSRAFPGASSSPHGRGSSLVGERQRRSSP